MDGIDFAARPTPIYFIGDSHVLVFRDLLFRGQRGADLFITRALYVPGCTAEGFLDSSGLLWRPVLDALRADHLIVENGDAWEPYHLSQQRHWKAVARAEGRLPADPIWVFSCGSLDALGSIEEPGVERIREILTPLFSGLRFLNSLGFGRLFLHYLPPPGLSEDDDRYRKFFGGHASVHTRYARFRLFNRLMAEFSANAGVCFIDLWDATTCGGGHSTRSTTWTASI